MRRMIEKIIQCYGQPVTLLRGTSESNLRAFFQPARSKTWQNMHLEMTPLGITPRGQYVYIGPVSPEMTRGDVLVVLNRRYRIQRSEVIQDQNGPIYRWALCMEEGDEDQWGSRRSDR